MATVRRMHSGFVPRVFETSYKAHLFRLRGNIRRAEQTEQMLERLLEDARNAPTAPAWWKNDVRAAAERGRQAAREHFETFGVGRKGANPFRRVEPLTRQARQRDPMKGKRILDFGGDTVVAHYKDKRAELTQQGAKWWDYGPPAWTEVYEPIQELATRLGHSILVTYKTNKDVSRVYPVNSEEAYRRGWYSGKRSR